MGTRGGVKRAEIIQLVARRAYNAHEISRLLGVDYKTARHHLKILVENDVLQAGDEAYGALYTWSATMKQHVATWDEIQASLADASGAPRDPRGEPTG